MIILYHIFKKDNKVIELLERIEMILEKAGVLVCENGDFSQISSLDYISILVEVEEEFGIKFEDIYLDSGLILNKYGLLSVVENIINVE